MRALVPRLNSPLSGVSRFRACRRLTNIFAIHRRHPVLNQAGKKPFACAQIVYRMDRLDEPQTNLILS